MTDENALYFAHQKVVQIVHGVVIRYRLTLNGPEVRAVHSEIEHTLPERSVRVTTGEHELLIVSAEWMHRQSEFAGQLQAWMMEHINLRAARPRRGARRYDSTWMTAWRDAKPHAR